MSSNFLFYSDENKNRLLQWLVEFDSVGVYQEPGGGQLVLVGEKYSSSEIDIYYL